MRNQFYRKLIALKKIHLIFFLIFLNTDKYLKAENSDSITLKNNYVYSFNGRWGIIYPTNEHLMYDLNHPTKFRRFGSGSFQFLKQTTGEKIWEQLYNYPLYGIGINTAVFPDNKELSNPVSVFGVLKVPVFRLNRITLNIEPEIGLSYNPKIFDPTLNELGQLVNPNIALPSHITSYLVLGLNVGYKLNRHFTLKLGYDYLHYSNGRLKTQNSGLNLLSPKLLVEYNVNNFVKPEVRKTIPAFVKNTSVDLSWYGGYKNFACTLPGVDTLTKYKGLYFKVFGITATLNRHISYMSKMGIGFTMGYDENNNTIVTVQNGNYLLDNGPLARRINFSLFASYEMIIDRFSLVMQPAIYIINRPKDNVNLLTNQKRTSTYQRLGLKYHIDEKLFTQVSVHAYSFHRADFIEWTLGYKFGVCTKKVD